MVLRHWQEFLNNIQIEQYPAETQVKHEQLMANISSAGNSLTIFTPPDES